MQTLNWLMGCQVSMKWMDTKFDKSVWRLLKLIFYKGHKNWWNLHRRFDGYYLLHTVKRELWKLFGCLKNTKMVRDYRESCFFSKFPNFWTFGQTNWVETFAFGVFSAKLRHPSWHCEPLVHGIVFNWGFFLQKTLKVRFEHFLTAQRDVYL